MPVGNGPDAVGITPNGKLGQVQAKIDAGEINGAINQLGAFMNQVSAFINNGSLTQAQAQPLLNGAIATQVSLTVPALAPTEAGN